MSAILTNRWRALGRAIAFLIAYAFSIAAASLPVGIGFFLFAREIEHEELEEISLHMEDVLLWLHASATILVMLAMLAFTALALRYLDRRGTFRDLGFGWTKDALRYVAISKVAAIVLVVVMFFVANRLGLIRITHLAWQVEEWSDVIQDFVGYLLLLASIVIAEELVFRGYTRLTLTQALTPRGALFASALLFALFRAFVAYATPLAVLNAFIAGLILGALFLLSGTLWVPITAHLAWNFVEGIVFSLPVAGMEVEGLIGTQSASGLWIGGKFGPEGSVIGLIALIVAGVGVWAVGRSKM